MKTTILSTALLAMFTGACVTDDLETSTLDQESHSWGGYHWARTSNPFTLALGDSVSSAWDSYLNTTVGDWSQSTVVDMTKVAGVSFQKKCKSVAGRVEVCSNTYGNNGWLGIASISITGGTHITAGTVRVNDTYYNTSTYNTPAWRNFVMCQEVGHTLGLGHQDEDFDNANLGSCMDYTSSPSSNQHPNAHDYDQLKSIYQHLDSSTTVGASAPGGPGNANGNANGANDGDWGELVESHGIAAVYVNDHGNGNRTITHVLWAPE